jgi:hypothetical protein
MILTAKLSFYSMIWIPKSVLRSRTCVGLKPGIVYQHQPERDEIGDTAETV